jgi:hypothetical protein
MAATIFKLVSNADELLPCLGGCLLLWAWMTVHPSGRRPTFPFSILELELADYPLLRMVDNYGLICQTTPQPFVIRHCPVSEPPLAAVP